MLLGFARVTSADDRDTERTALARAGVEAGAMRFLAECWVSDAEVADARAALLDELVAGDVIVVTRLGRLAESVPSLLGFCAELWRREVEIRVLDQALDSRDPRGGAVLRAFALLDGLPRVRSA